ncbi:hypothetical protein [Rhizobium phaseoli]|uniref:hypothetical protein n=1 Tax=Rhizobium phaseoli TaxID=396 RepID=UPI0012372FED|nr:hypothetical protein [Rhizobium phaseoli]
MAAPYFFTSTIVKADELTDGLIKDVKVVANALSMVPAGRVDGTDRQVVGGGTVYGRALQQQADTMVNNGNFTVTVDDEAETRELCSNGTGYMFTRFRPNLRNCCLPLGSVSNQDGTAHGGAMTLVEGPNLVALRVLVGLLENRGYSSSQISDYCWPLRPSVDAMRERALIFFNQVIKVHNRQGNSVYADRDVLHASAADCVVRYTHNKGVPDGGGEGAIIVNNKVELRFAFKFTPSVYQ